MECGQTYCLTDYAIPIVDLPEGFISKEIEYKDTDIYNTYKMYLDNPSGMQEKLFDYKETKEIVLDLSNCVACWSGISGWDGIVSNDLTLVTTDFKQYICKHEYYNIINPQNLRII